MRGRIVGSAALVLAGCAGQLAQPARRAPGSGAEPSLQAAQSEPAIWDQTTDTLAARMRDVALGMYRAGLRYSGFGIRGFMPAGSHRTLPVDVGPRQCLTLVALASDAVRDLDATLYAPDGSPVAQDAQPDAHPTLQVCVGPVSQRFYYSLRLYHGAGSFMVAGFYGDRSRLGSAQAVMGGGAGPAAARGSVSAQPDSGELNRLRTLWEGLERRGFAAWQGPLRVPLAARQRVRMALDVDPATCYAVVGFAGPGLANLDLRIYDEEGRELAHDLAPWPDAAVQFCSDRDAQFSAEVHAETGQGLALVAFYRGSHATIGGNNALWLGSRAGTRLSKRPLGKALARFASANRQDYRRSGRRTLGSLSWGEATQRALVLPGGACSVVAVTGGRGLGRLSLTVLDEDGRQLGFKDGKNASAAVRLCSSKRRRAQAIVVARSGYGRFAIEVWSRSTPRDLPAGATEKSLGHLLEAREQARAAGFRPRQDLAASGHEVTLSQDGSAPSLPLPLEADRCLRAHAVVAGEAGEIELRLVANGKPMTRQAGYAPRLRMCTDTALPDATLELRSLSGVRRAHLLVFERPPAFGSAHR
ncbi:MAG: hypothetical protein MJD61_08690 [Proteobacteria bacterium]|nr:hypothetical protein [Pseudomonadota bacterium]